MRVNLIGRSSATSALPSSRKALAAQDRSGLLQMTDENEVSSMLWTILNQPNVTVATFFNALGSTRMNNRPWSRGYTWHLWSQLDNQGRPLNPLDTGISRPALPDFLDALVCGGVAVSAVDAATLPSTQYPYPSTQPICQ